MTETTYSVLRLGEGSSVLGIRVGVSHLTKLTWEGFDSGGGPTLGVALMRSVSGGG